jgi:hypothetical protein
MRWTEIFRERVATFFFEEYESFGRVATILTRKYYNLAQLYPKIFLNFSG